jgi:hypothetical protein
VIAVVGENETAVLDVTTEIISFLWIELDEFVAADIGEGVVEDLGAIEVEDFFLQVYGDGGVFDQGVQQIGRHPLIRVPVARMVPESHESKLVSCRWTHRSWNFFKVEQLFFNFLDLSIKKAIWLADQKFT